MASLPLPGTTNRVLEDNGCVLEQHQQALRGYLQSYIIRRLDSCQDANIFLGGTINVLAELLHRTLTDWTGLKTFISLKVVFSKGSDASETIRSHFNSTQREVMGATDVTEELRAAFAQILLRIDEFVNNGSNWTVVEISHLDVHLARYQALRGGSTFVNLPSKVKSKRAIINVCNNDQKCFMWSILSALHPVEKNPQQMCKYARYQDELNFDGIEFPVNVKNIDRFERLNNIGISIFGWEEDDVIPLRICKEGFGVVIDLMLVDGHYCWIKNIDALLSDQRRNGAKKYFCRRCLIPQYSEQKLLLHYDLCRKNEPTRTRMPQKECIEFSNYHRGQRAPYVIYCDFESLLHPITSCSPSSCNSYTTPYQHHEPCSFGLIDIFGCCADRMERGEYFTYRGNDAVNVFLQKIVELTENHQQRTLHPKPQLTKDEWTVFNDSTHCYLCGGHFVQNEKVRDHCHYCSRYRGAAHYDCNLSYRLQNKVQVVFHNLKRYDGHIIMQHIGDHCSDYGLQLDCIAKGMEDYVSFSLTKQVPAVSRKRKHALSKTPGSIADSASDDENDCLLDYDTEMQMPPTALGQPNPSSTVPWKIVFLDSLQFLPSSLDVLVNNLIQQGNHCFPTMKHHFDMHSDLLLRKGLYPYEYMDSWERFDEPILLPLHQFHSSLTDSTPSRADYDHAKHVWKTLNLSSMGQYFDLYLKKDVLLLCDVFENFRAFSLNNYGLDPAHYFTLPSLGWDACLKLTKVRLELLQDVDMYQFFEAGIRGGISMITHRYAKANNVYLPDFNPADPSMFIIYADMNNLYGTTMIQSLPIRNFHWMSRSELDAIDWLQQTDSQLVGYVLEVDLEYPAHLHSSHNDYPLAPEKLKVTDDMLSPYCRRA